MAKAHHMLNPGSPYFQIRGRSDLFIRELTGRSERQQRDFWEKLKVMFAIPLKLHCPKLVNSFKAV
jgi:hypothetical protein